MPDGVPHIPGSPGGLRGAAGQLDSAAAELAGLGGSISTTGAGLANGWSGVAASAAMTAVTDIAAPLPEAAEGFARVSDALRRYARELEEAQRDADRAREAVQAARVAAATATNLLTELAAVPEPEPTSVAHLQGRLQQAGDDLQAATSAGQRAYERARDAARNAAATIEGVAAVAPAPPPPPPPPPPPEDDRPWYEKAASGAWGGLSDAGSFVGDKASDGWRIAGGIGPAWMPGTPAFGTDAIEGAAGMIGGTGVFLWQGTKATSPLYNLIDPQGGRQAREGFEQGFEYAWDHPWETGKQVLGLHHFENGEPGKFAGEVGLTALLTLATGGAGATVKLGQGGSRASRLPAGVSAAAGSAGKATLTPRGDLLVRHWTPIDPPGPLPQGLADTFRTSTYDEVQLTEPRRFFRDYEDPSKMLRAHWNQEPSTGPMASMLENAILPEWGNNATKHVEIEVPAGTTVYEGPAAPQRVLPGGRTQVVITEVKPEWVVP